MTREELMAGLNDVEWRLSNLYKIIVKGEDDSSDLVIQFRPNKAQRDLMMNLHSRNIILKARQLGFTTLICILWLDTALFSKSPIRCGIIAQDREAAEVIFRDKVKFAYDNLPEELRPGFPLERDSASELLFSHNHSSIRVATSMRSGTIHRLHVSEFGKICAKYPDKAKEVVTGSFQAVPLNGITIVESTAEGDEGEFYDMSVRAAGFAEQGKALTPRDWKLHFHPWYAEPQYEMDPDGVIITEKDHAYFDKIEIDAGIELSERKRAWYVATRNADFPNNPERMWQEYPSTWKEAFQRSTEGCYYTDQMTALRKRGGIREVPVVDKPVNTFWDIGNSDGCAIWFHQQIGMEHRFVRYMEEFGLTLRDYFKLLQDTGYVWGKHYLPHDANHKRLSDTNKSIKEMLEDLGLRNIEVVPQISNLNAGISATRAALAQTWFDEHGCHLGIKRLDNYRKRWNQAQARYVDEPDHNVEGKAAGADAFRQFAQALEAGSIGTGVSKPFVRKPGSSNWRRA